MARILGAPPGDRWERYVVDQLKQQLPAECVVIPGVRWSLERRREGASNAASFVRDGEADCVVLIPGAGLVVVEVKGSREFKVEDGRWFRLDHDHWEPLAESPIEQATRNMHELRKILCSRNGWPESRFPGGYAYVVVYPQGRAEGPPAMADSSTLVTQRELPQLASRIRLALTRRNPDGAGREFTPAVMESVARTLTNAAFRVEKADTPLDLQDDLGKIDTLTRQQFAALRGLFEMRRIAVVGPAGSGKTLLAIWRLRGLLEEGRKALYVCFNKRLADYLRAKNPGDADAIVSVDSFFLGLSGVSVRASEGFFREELPQLLEPKVYAWSEQERYDAIIVDEGQDFGFWQQYILSQMLRADGSWAFFADWRQNLYRQSDLIQVDVDVVYNLHHNCRNTVSINAAANEYTNSSILPMPGLPEGVSPIVERLRDQRTMATRAWEIARQWAGEGTLAILSPFKLENSAVRDSPAGHGLRLVTDLSRFGEPGTAYFSTVRSFKGLEAHAVIVVDALPTEESPVFAVEDLYVACTRATARLALLTSSDAAFTQLGGRNGA